MLPGLRGTDPGILAKVMIPPPGIFLRTESVSSFEGFAEQLGLKAKYIRPLRPAGLFFELGRKVN